MGDCWPWRRTLWISEENTLKTCKVPGILKREGSSVICDGFGVEPLLLRIKGSLYIWSGWLLDTSPVRVAGMFHVDKALESSQSNCMMWLGKTEVWGFLLKLLALQPDSGEVEENGWIDSPQISHWELKYPKVDWMAKWATKATLVHSDFIFYASWLS